MLLQMEIPIKGKSKNPVINYNYAEELIKEIPELENNLSRYQTKERELIKRIKKSSSLSVPYSQDNFIDRGMYENYSNYKEHLMDYWVSPEDGKNCISEERGTLVYVIGYILTAIFAIICIFTNSYKFLNLNIVEFVLICGLSYEIISGIVSTWYYIIRPNKINRKSLKKLLKEVQTKIKVLENDITVKKNLVESYKLSTLDPNKQFSNIKSRNIPELKSEVDNAREKVLPNISEGYKEIYSRILDKCDSLLDKAKDNGSIVTEISKIYIIYLNDINNILMNPNANFDSINTLLKNLENFVDRKLSKVETLQKTMLESDINALNSALTEED